MTTPKPRVEHDDECWWIWWWSCPCGEHTEPWELDAFGFEELVASATLHSRIHSAERIAEYLQGLSDINGAVYTRYGDVPDLTSSLAYGSAANLIRKYLT